MSAAADAQTPGRARGAITATDGNVLSVKSREGQDLKIVLAPNATFAYMKALKLSDVAPGTPLGTSAAKGAGRPLTTLRVSSCRNPASALQHRAFACGEIRSVS